MMDSKYRDLEFKLICPTDHRICAYDRCPLWQEYSNTHYQNTGVPGRCLLTPLAMGLIKNMQPEQMDDNSITNYVPEVPF